MNYGDTHSMQAVDAWIRYIELFGSTEITVQKLINHGYDYSDIIQLLEQAVNDNAPIDAEMLFCKT
ncbi:MAG: hypothetical protein R3302_08665, partial [Sulfurimonadaceae bacterium]|nr:hypothetical protein [Sulfurimonadaceae bacterium]